MQHCPIKLFRRRGVTLVEVLVSLSVIGLLLALLLPAVQSSREAARKMNCLSNVKQIALGALNYESIFGYFPSSGGLDQLFGDNYPSALTTIRIPGVAGGNFLLPGGGQNGRRP